MPSKYPLPKPEFFARLKKNPLLANDVQQATLEQYATGEIGIETTVARILAEARARGPVLQKERDTNTAERARRVRIQREMAENETAKGPTFVPSDEEGNPLTGNPEEAPRGEAIPDESLSDESSEEPSSKPADTDHSNGDQEQEMDQDEIDRDLNTEQELDEFGQPVRASENEQFNQAEWDEQ